MGSPYIRTSTDPYRRCDSSVSTPTRHRLDSPRIESRWERGFPHPSRLALGPTQPIQWVPRLFSGVKPGRGVDHPYPSSGEVKQSVELYLYFPSGASWPTLIVTDPITGFFFPRLCSASSFRKAQAIGPTVLHLATVTSCYYRIKINSP